MAKKSQIDQLLSVREKGYTGLGVCKATEVKIGMALSVAKALDQVCRAGP